MNISYAGVKQLEGKYLLQDRTNGTIYETTQFIFILVGIYLFANYDKEIRKKYVRKFYDMTSLFKITLPTPIMAGVRTSVRQFSSCVLIESDDDLNSINATASAIVKYVSKRAGIGINGGRIRALGSRIRSGETSHTGCIPFYKYFLSAVKCCSQGGVRGGAATLFYPVWHLEVESLIVLKNNTGTEENRIRQMDYGVQFNYLIYKRFLENGNITLFSPHEVKDLYEAFFNNQKQFEFLYNKYENDSSIKKKTVKARDLFLKFMQERANTGRIYLQNVDHCNTNSAFNSNLAPIHQSNLCMEITLPTKPLYDIQDKDGEIALCTLSAINLGNIDCLEELEEVTDVIVRALDHLLDYQEYFLEASKNSSLKRRTLGIGVTNLAFYLAKNNKKYSDGSANDLVHNTFEYIQYYCLKSSLNLAKEYAPCTLFHETSYAKGILPIDRYKKDVDYFCTNKLLLNWEDLREQIKKIRLKK